MKGMEGLHARIEAIGRNTPNVVAIALHEEAQTILADSVTNYVPFDTGNLAGSAKVELPVVSGNTVSVELGYGAEYALSVHENPRSGKTGGTSPSGASYRSWASRGEWKYLEQPLKAHSPEVAHVLRTAIDDYVDSLKDGSEVNVRPVRRAPRPDILEGP